MSLSMAHAEPDMSHGFVQSMGALMSENRAFSRIGVQYSAVVRVQGTEEVIEATVTNLSGNGLRFRMGEEHVPGTLLSVTMQCDQSYVVTSAEVVRVDNAGGAESYEIACRFVD